jgi:hypothetical protein
MAIGLTACLYICGCFGPAHQRLTANKFVFTPTEPRNATLQGLDVSDDNVIAAIPDLRQIQCNTLNMPGCRVTDRVVPAIVQVDSIETLDLSGTDVTIEGLRQLRALPRLKRIWISVAYYQPEDVNALRKLIPHAVIEEGSLGTIWRREEDERTGRKPREAS